jgi:hypothetical protein
MATITEQGNTVTFAEVRKDVGDRNRSKTPPFFERIKGWAKTAAWMCGGIGSVGIFVVTRIASGGIEVSPWITIVMSILSGLGVLGAGGGIGGAIVAKMTTANKEILDRPSNEVVKI